MQTPYHSSDFINDVRAKYSAIEAETFWACEPFFTQFLRDGLMRSWLSEQLRALTDDSVDVRKPPPKESLVHQGEGWAISVNLLDTSRKFIHVAPYLAFYAPLSSDLVVDRYRLPPSYRNDVFDPNVQVERVDTFTVQPGHVLKLETESFAYDFQLTRPTAVLRFASRNIRPLEWLFSRTTLRAWQANDADLQLTQLRIAAYVLGKIAHQSSIVPLKRLSWHPHHSVRWAAIQSLGRVSRTEALSSVREAVNDPHPHVRRAAEKTLEQLSRQTLR